MRQQLCQMFRTFTGKPFEQIPAVGKGLHLIRFGTAHHAVENGRGLSPIVWTVQRCSLNCVGGIGRSVNDCVHNSLR